MVFRLKEIYARSRDAIYKPVLLSNSARPAARQYIFERFGFSDALKGVAQNSFY